MKKIFLTGLVFVLFCAFSGRLMAEEKINPSKILVCSKLFTALGRIGGDSKEARDILVKGLADKDFFLRAYAADALGYLNAKDAIPMLKKLTADENYFVRIVATAALLRLGGVEETALLDFLKDSEPQVRGNAVDQLATFGDKYLVVIYKTLLSDDNDFVKTEALTRLGEKKFAQADGSKIVSMLEAKNPELRQAACFALGQIGYANAIPNLNKSLSDKESKVRASAKVALSLLGDRSIIGLLWQDADSKDEYLRGSSYVALANLKEINALPVLLKEIAAPETLSFVRVQSATALMILKSYISGSIDNALTGGDVKSVQPSRNLEISYTVNGQSLVSIFINAVNDSKNILHKDMPQVIARLNERDCLPALREAMLKDEPDTAAATAGALGSLDDRDALKYLIEVCKKYGCGKI
jgi:HEAT repeat protein